MARRLRALDFSSCPLGPPARWPETLRTTVGILLAAATQIVLFWGPDYVALYNDAYAPTIGEKHPRALGRPAAENWTELWDDLGPLLRSVVETGETFVARDRPFYIERHGFGETAYFDVSYSAVRDEQGRVGGVLCLVSETTERVRTERRLRFLIELGHQLRDLSDPRQVMAVAAEAAGRYLGTSCVGYGELDAAGAHLTVEHDWSDGTTPRLVGRLRLESYGRSLRHSIRAGRIIRIDDVLADADAMELQGAALLGIGIRAGLGVPFLQDGRPVALLWAHQPTPRVWRDDEAAVMEEVARRIWESVGRIRAEQGLRALNRDLERRVEERTSALMAAEETLRHAQKMEAVGQLTGGIAHDFNNMLQGVIGGIQMAGRRIGAGRPDQAQRYLEAACEAADRAAGLTRRLLAFARRQRLEPKPVHVDRLIAALADLVRRTVGPAIEVRLELGDGAGTVLCDPNELENAVLNLCINGRDAMQGGGRLTIAASETELTAADLAESEAAPGRFVVITVSDIGVGMAREVLERVFEPFFTTKPQGQGTGLGLSQIYGFVSQSGGLVRIESAPGKGTRVRLFLPSHAGEVLEQTPARAPPRSGQAWGSVLLVDDEEVARRPAAERLRELGLAVTEARDGAEALRRLEEARPDLLITDVGLPGSLNGRQLAEAALDRMPGLRVLFITGYAGTALPAGMEVIDKPFRLDELVWRVQAALGRPQA